MSPNFQVRFNRSFNPAREYSNNGGNIIMAAKKTQKHAKKVVSDKSKSHYGYAKKAKTNVPNGHKKHAK